MRFLGIGKDNDLGSLYLRLMQAGHEVRVFIQNEDSGDTLGGMVDRVADWRTELDWVRGAGRDGVILFESTGFGEVADALRRDGFQVIGSSALGDRLEDDRAFGQAVMRETGMRVAESHAFTRFQDGIRFVEAHAGRYVLKLSGSDYASSHTFPSELPDGRDMIAMLEWHRDRWAPEAPPFILMEYLDGVEIGVGGYFNGRHFLRPACLDWEHKRFFTGDMGEMTGEMGTLVTYEGFETLFAATLQKLEPMLRAAGHVGYLNINTIVNERGIFPLEFTCRFGYPGYAILDPLQTAGWDDLFRRMLDPGSTDFPAAPGFCVGVVVTVPPFPYRTDYGKTTRKMPILFRREPDAADWRNMHLGEVALEGGSPEKRQPDRQQSENGQAGIGRPENGRLVTSGVVGYVMVVTGAGETVEAAQARAYARVRNVVVPKMRYRTDIGDRFLARDRVALRDLGILP